MIRRVALVLLLAAPLSAQVTPKQAVASFRSQAKTSIKTFKQVVKDRHADFLEVMDQELADYVGGAQTWQELVTGTFDALKSLQILLQDDLEAVMVEIANVGAQSLIDLGEPADAFPLDMYFGLDGALDQAIEAAHAVVDKELVSAHKALKKATKALEAGDDVVMLVKLQRPDVNDHFAVNAEKPSAPTSELISVHTLVTASARGATGDGVINMAGRGYIDTVVFDFDGPEVFFSDDAAIDTQTHQWAWQSSTTIAEGNYILSASINGDVSALTMSIGVP